MLSAGIHKGEAAALKLASRIHADLVLIDDRRGVIAVERLNLNVTGTLGVLGFAAERGLIDFAHAVPALKPATFECHTRC